MNTLDDPEVRYYRRFGAVLSLAVTAAVVTTVTFIGASATRPNPVLAVNCALDGMTGAVFDDSGTHAAMCAGHASPEPAAHVLAPPPAPSATATAEPPPATF